MRIGFIGAGMMAEALIKSFISSKVTVPAKISASDLRDERLKIVSRDTKAFCAKDNIEVLKRSEIVFIAVKPQVIGQVLSQIREHVKGKLIISIAAGITLKQLTGQLDYNRVVRVMPNTPCLVGEMAAGYSFASGCADKDKETVSVLLNSAGVALELEESSLDAVTGLSGSGPAFIAYILEPMIEAGIEAGLDKQTARKLALATASGTALLLMKTGLEPQSLIKMVRSPNGTTHEGMLKLEKSNAQKAMKKAVEAAIARSVQLGMQD